MAYRVKATTRRESLASRLTYGLPLGLAAILLAIPSLPLPVLGDRFLPLATWPFRAGAALTVAGLLFTVWARVHLGANWSATVTIKESHELITGGPYALVRHPIYSGLLLAFAGSALACGEWRGAIAVAVAAGAFRYKLRIEERWMEAQFGEAYRNYRKRVAALVPCPISRSAPRE
jgi:protein-S-isoprenylcysteine O-methyltransferase Ste14